MSGEVSAFLPRRPGQIHGRVNNPSEFDQTDDHALVLGSTQKGIFRRFKQDARVEYEQTIEKDSGRILKLRGKLRSPDRMPLVTGTEPFNIGDGEELIISIDYGDPQNIVFSSSDFDDISNATSVEVRDSINSQIQGAKAFITGAGQAYILSNKKGLGSKVQYLGSSGSGTIGDRLGIEELVWTVLGIPLEPGEVRDVNDFKRNLDEEGTSFDFKIQMKLENALRNDVTLNVVVGSDNVVSGGNNVTVVSG